MLHLTALLRHSIVNDSTQFKYTAIAKSLSHLHPHPLHTELVPCKCSSYHDRYIFYHDVANCAECIYSFRFVAKSPNASKASDIDISRRSFNI